MAAFAIFGHDLFFFFESSTQLLKSMFTRVRSLKLSSKFKVTDWFIKEKPTFEVPRSFLWLSGAIYCYFKFNKKSPRNFKIVFSSYVGIANSFAHLQISALLVRISKNQAKYVQLWYLAKNLRHWGTTSDHPTSLYRGWNWDHTSYPKVLTSLTTTWSWYMDDPL